MENKILRYLLLFFLSLPVSLKKNVYGLILRLILGKVNGKIDIHYDVEFRTPAQIKIGNNTIIKKGTIINGRSNTKKYGVSLGERTYIKENCYIDSYGGYIEIEGPCAIGQYTIFDGLGGIKIGKYVFFGGHCYVVASNHNYESLDVPYMLQGDRGNGIVIEENVWIGGCSIILDGVHIGRNAVIGAGSIVASNVPANSVYVDRNPKLLKSILHRKEFIEQK